MQTCLGCGKNANRVKSVEGLDGNLSALKEEIAEALDVRKHGEDAFVTDCHACGAVIAGEAKDDWYFLRKASIPQQR